MTFKGIPIDGPLKEFVAKMEKVGFTNLGTFDGTAILQGGFAGYSGCVMAVFTLKNSNMVNAVSIEFPSQCDWSSLEANYQQLKRVLTSKYGEPVKCMEEFQGYNLPRDNEDKLLSLKMDQCSYNTIIETTAGYILLQLCYDDVYGTHCSLGYYDKINIDAAEAAAMDDL